VQQAAIEMAKGGIEPATIAAGGLRDVLNLAAAGEVGIAEAAEIASKQLGVWVDSAASADQKAAFLKDSVNLLSQAANASTVDVDDLALGLANSGKSADIAGLSFRETVTSMALISSGFSSAADAGTSFKTFLTRLQPQTDSQADAFKRLNLLTAEGTSVFYDASARSSGWIRPRRSARQLQGDERGPEERGAERGLWE
jgi:TP901 family phage tail tape measure protein